MRFFRLPHFNLSMALDRPQTLLPLARHWLSKASAIFPSACALCGTTGTHVLCDDCKSDFFASVEVRCYCCARSMPNALSPHSVCGACLHQPPAFDATVVVVDYAAPVDQLVLALKFGARLALAPLFAELLLDALIEHDANEFPLPDFLVAVPLGLVRLRERGFNQALEIAKPLSNTLGVPLASNLLTRIRDTAAQAQLSPVERRHNLRGAFTFAAEKIHSVVGKHVGVIDDVMTTGETLNEVALTLKRFGAARVTNLVFARTVPK
jgi:ComF family protein